ncbi:MAG: hypothetical protein RDV41_12615 [Planctomycetota bacterium]|nr:hypothetical protein [Planctomycetota bacterium]
MKRDTRLVVCITLAALLSVCVVVAQEPKGEPPAGVKAPTEAQLREWGYLLYRASNINVINGLNLSREQAVALKEMALEIEEMAGEMPKASYEGATELATISDCFNELVETLPQNGDISDELRDKVLKMRTLESASIRAGLVLPPRKSCEYASCERCHVTSSGDAVGGGEGAEFDAIGPAVKAEMALAHLFALYDNKTMRKLSQSGKRIDALLTDSQKSIFSTFSCCLIPPKGLSDPVLVGQASSADWEVDVLNKMRTVPESGYPAARKMLIATLLKYATVKNPGLTEAEKRTMSDDVGRALDKARELSDADFQLSKEELCAALHGAKPQELSGEKKMFSQAFFLLIPGSAKMYDEVIRRIDDPSTVERPGTTPGDAEKPT